jgi:hypothetical protein
VGVPVCGSIRQPTATATVPIEAVIRNCLRVFMARPS